MLVAAGDRFMAGMRQPDDGTGRPGTPTTA